MAAASLNTTEVPSLLPEYRTRGFINCQDCHNNPDGTGEGGTQGGQPAARAGSRR